MYLDKFQDKQDEAKGIEDTMNSGIEQFRKRSIQYTNIGKMSIFSSLFSLVSLGGMALQTTTIIQFNT